MNRVSSYYDLRYSSFSKPAATVSDSHNHSMKLRKFDIFKTF